MGSGTITAANAEPAGYSSQDETFFRLLTTPHGDDKRTIVVTNPQLMRAHGLLICELTDNGVSGLDAIHQLMAEGPYTFETANSISAAAKVAYCLRNVGR